MESLSIEIARRVRARRQELGLQQADLAERAGLSASYVSRLEAGQAGVPDDLVKIVKALGTSLAMIVGETDEEILAEVRRRLPDGTELALSFERIAKGLSTQPEAEQDFIRQTIQALADRFGHESEMPDGT